MHHIITCTLNLVIKNVLVDDMDAELWQCMYKTCTWSHHVDETCSRYTC